MRELYGSAAGSAAASAAARPRRRLRPRRPAPRPGGAAAAAASATCSATSSAVGRGRQQARARPQKGADVETTATIGFTDAIDGVTISLRLTSDAPCPDCNGTGGKPGTTPHICPECEGAGFVVSSVGGAFSINETCPECGGRQLVYDEPCPTCHGTGRGCPRARIQARIPAGVKDGQRIRLGQGRGRARTAARPATSSSPCKVTPHRLFGRKGDNLTLDVPVSFDEAALGAEIKIPTLGGSPVTAQDPGRHAQRPHLPGARQGRRARRTAPRATCSPPSQVQVPARSTTRPARPSRPTAPPATSQPLRANLFERGRDDATRSRLRSPGPDAAVYVISVAAELTGLHPQTLRTYERMGLIMPGPHRRWRPPLLATATSSCCARSPTLTSAGIGIEGVRRILELENQVAALQARNEELLAELDATREALRQALTMRRTDPNKLPVLRGPEPEAVVGRLAPLTALTELRRPGVRRTR